MIQAGIWRPRTLKLVYNLQEIHTIIKVEKTFKVIKSNVCHANQNTALSATSSYLLNTSGDGDSTTSLCIPFQCLTNCFFSGEIFPNVQPEHSLMQLEVISSSCYLLSGRRGQPPSGYTLLSESCREQQSLLWALLSPG